MTAPTGAGDRLRATREELGMSLRDVHRASGSVAKELRNRSFVIPISRLHFYETEDATPSIYRLYTLARLYGRKLPEILAWYGIPHR
jgi:transcriptional regulator with XRE-family HTH domain